MTCASYYKRYWDYQLADLTHKTIAAHSLWIVEGSRLMVYVIIFSQEIPLYYEKHGKARLKVKTK